MAKMTNKELLAIMYSLEALLETSNEKKALEVIKKIIDQTEDGNKKSSPPTK